MKRYLLSLVAAFALAGIGVALAQTTGTVSLQDRSGTITLGGTAQSLMPANPARHGCMVQNQSATDLFINELGTAAAVQPSIKVVAGSQYNCVTPPPGSAFSIFGATTAQAFAAREW